MVRWCSVQQFRHESNVGYSQTKRFNAGKPFLVGKCWDLKLRFSYICHIQRIMIGGIPFVATCQMPRSD